MNLVLILELEFAKECELFLIELGYHWHNNELFINNESMDKPSMLIFIDVETKELTWLPFSLYYGIEYVKEHFGDRGECYQPFTIDELSNILNDN